MMDTADMERYGMSGARLKLGGVLVSKCYDIYMIVLIVIYSILIAVYFVLEDTLFNEANLEKEDSKWEKS